MDGSITHPAPASAIPTDNSSMLQADEEKKSLELLHHHQNSLSWTDVLSKNTGVVIDDTPLPPDTDLPNYKDVPPKVNTWRTESPKLQRHKHPITPITAPHQQNATDQGNQVCSLDFLCSVDSEPKHAPTSPKPVVGPKVDTRWKDGRPRSPSLAANRRSPNGSSPLRTRKTWTTPVTKPEPSVLDKLELLVRNTSKPAPKLKQPEPASVDLSITTNIIPESPVQAKHPVDSAIYTSPNKTADPVVRAPDVISPQSALLSPTESTRAKIRTKSISGRAPSFSLQPRDSSSALLIGHSSDAPKHKQTKPSFTMGPPAVLTISNTANRSPFFLTSENGFMVLILVFLLLSFEIFTRDHHLVYKTNCVKVAGHLSRTGELICGNSHY